MELFEALDGISPWWWAAGALVLGIIEVLTFSYFLIWPGLAALALAVVLWVVPGLSGGGQVMLFAVLSAVFTLIGRQIVMNRPAVADTRLNNRAAALIGRRAQVIDGFADGAVGTVEIDGVRWRGRLSPGVAVPQTGAILEVSTAEGMTLILSQPE